VDRGLLLDQLATYCTSFPEEAAYVVRFEDLLREAPCFERTHLPGHLTGSLWIVNPERTETLLVHHVKLNKWVQPGGHADGDENVVRVALREGEEETGLLHLHTDGQIFDLDIHPIPARADFPAHLHFDVRFLAVASPSEKIMVSEESHDVRWIPLASLANWTTERSVLRMKDKIVGHG